MTNTTIRNATNLTNFLQKANGIYESIHSIETRVTGWYNHTDVTDIEVLAAAALIGNYNKKFTYDDMLDAHQWWFPHNPYEEIFG